MRTETIRTHPLTRRGRHDLGRAVAIADGWSCANTLIRRRALLRLKPGGGPGQFVPTKVYSPNLNLAASRSHRCYRYFSIAAANAHMICSKTIPRSETQRSTFSTHRDTRLSGFESVENRPTLLARLSN
jgi:hypothetical protein